MKLRPWLIVAAAALALGACGKRGVLERPPPLWGKAHDQGQEQNRDKNPQPVRSDRDRPATPETRNVPIPTDPVETGKSDPVGSSPVQPQ